MIKYNIVMCHYDEILVNVCNSWLDLCGFPVYSAPQLCGGTEQEKESDLSVLCMGWVVS